MRASLALALALLVACSSTAELEPRELANGGELDAPDVSVIGPRPAPVDYEPPAARRVVHAAPARRRALPR